MQLGWFFVSPKELRFCCIFCVPGMDRCLFHFGTKIEILFYLQIFLVGAISKNRKLFTENDPQLTHKMPMPQPCSQISVINSALVKKKRNSKQIIVGNAVCEYVKKY